MIDENNIYTEMQRNYYDSTADIMMEQNHHGHNSNPDYYGLLLKDITENPIYWENKKALDFGCGCGRNIKNLINLANFSQADGCDISKENITRSNQYLINSQISENKYKLYTTNGITIDPIESNQYDLVMATIVLQHICVHEIRFGLLKDIYRVLNQDGLFTFQMAQYDRKIVNGAYYYDNTYDAKSTNGYYDVNIDDPQNLIDDLTIIGFKNISYTIRPEWDANLEKYVSNTNKWIFVKAYK